MSNKLKQIQAILANEDVRDLRATIKAIQGVLSADEAPVAVIEVFNNPGSDGPLKATVVIDYSTKRLEPRHMKAVCNTIQEFAIARAEEEVCNDPNCPVHGDASKEFGELLKKLEEATIAALKKGGAA